MTDLATIAAKLAPMQTPEYARVYRQLWGEPAPYYQPFTAWTYPGHDRALDETHSPTEKDRT